MISIFGNADPAAQLAYYMLLVVPIVATIVGISRHIIGIKSLGIYAPIVLTFSFYGLGLRFDESGVPYSDILVGVRYGLIFILVLTASTYLIVNLMKKSRMNYFPKIAIVISFASLALTAFILFSYWVNNQQEVVPVAALFTAIFGDINFNEATALSLVLIASVTEKFTSVLYKSKFKKAMLITAETVLTSVFSYILIAWPSFSTLIDNNKVLILLVFPINYFVGKYRGLRIREYLRFSEVLNKQEQANK